MMRQFGGDGLGKEPPLGGQENDRHVCARSSLPSRQSGGGQDRFGGGEDGLWLHHHSTSTTVGSIVGDVVFIGCIVADIVQRDGNAAALLGPFEDTLFKRAAKH